MNFRVFRFNIRELYIVRYYTNEHLCVLHNFQFAKLVPQSREVVVDDIERHTMIKIMILR